MNTPFTKEERQALLNQYFPAYKRWQDLDYQLAVSGENDQDALTRETDQLGRNLMDLRDQYRSHLPVIPLSRCPFSSQVLYHSIDHYGIDGLWWNYNAPMRPVENCPATFHSITGALSLETPIENAPFLCVPGPAIPYIIPDILGNEHIEAVLSAITIGRHQGYVMMYYTDNPLTPVPRANSWGMDYWEILDYLGTYRWDSSPFSWESFDFQIDRWIAKGKLHWIEPGDRTFTLRQGTDKCPYLTFAGTKNIQMIRNGELIDTGEQEGK
jgi:hypothetical protein